MDKITYLDHSGFMIETSDALLVFDYYRDPAHEVIKTLRHNPELPVIFFISHNHRDHFNHEIFHLGQNHKRLYVISNDVFDREDNLDVSVSWISPGDSLENLPGDISVKAYGTTGKGCSFAVTTAAGRHIFHGGELGEPLAHNHDAPRDAERYADRFTVAINRIAQEQTHFDLAMMAVDTTDSPDFATGATRLIEKIDIDTFVPFHTDDPTDRACDFSAYPFTKKVDTHMICLTRPGESATF